MKAVREVSALRNLIREARVSRQSISFVPTMGALHEGHLSLVRLARREAPFVVVSIFVNPLQFAPGEDLARYPRREADDLAALEREGVDVVYLPRPEDLYPPGFSTAVEVGGVSEGGEGGARPGHFRGVATVVAKLFLQVAPDVAVFGQKDLQQVAVIRRMVRDLDFPLRLVVGETVREPDGLAMSSRNAYLSPEERALAAALPRALFERAVTSKGEAEPRGAAAVRRKLTAGGSGWTKSKSSNRHDGPSEIKMGAPSSGGPGRKSASSTRPASLTGAPDARSGGGDETPVDRPLPRPYPGRGEGADSHHQTLSPEGEGQRPSPTLSPRGGSRQRRTRTSSSRRRSFRSRYRRPASTRRSR